MIPVSVSDITNTVLELEIFSYSSKCFKIKILMSTSYERNRRKNIHSNKKVEDRTTHRKICYSIHSPEWPAVEAPKILNCLPALSSSEVLWMGNLLYDTRRKEGKKHRNVTEELVREEAPGFLLETRVLTCHDECRLLRLWTASLLPPCFSCPSFS